MKTTRRRLWFAVLMTLGLTTGCKGTYLEVVFTGTVAAPIHRIVVDLTLLDAPRATSFQRGNLPNEADGGVITLPTSAAFLLNDESGRLAVAATALGANRDVLATAGPVTTTIKHGETWTITMPFGPPANAAALTATPTDN